MHVCPMVTGIVPHVGGPILPPGCPTVLIGGLPAARVGDLVTCVGPPDAIVLGSFTVLIGGQPAARMGDLTAHGGMIAMGFPTVMIGDAGSGGGGGGSGAGSARGAGDPSGDGTSAVDRVIRALSQAATTSGPPTLTPQVAALLEAADEAVPLVEQCPYAHHG